MEIIDIKLDNNGHLQDTNCWNKEVAEYLSAMDNLSLSKHHWDIINLVRQIYLETETLPSMRLLVKAIKVNISADIATSRHLYQLFPDGPIRFACKYAGLPKPKHCL